jgi:hypothetical protein
VYLQQAWQWWCGALRGGCADWPWPLCCSACGSSRCMPLRTYTYACMRTYAVYCTCAAMHMGPWAHPMHNGASPVHQWSKVLFQIKDWSGGLPQV